MRIKQIGFMFALMFAGVCAYGAVYEFRNRNIDNDYVGSSTWKLSDGTLTNMPPASGDGAYVTSGTGHSTLVSVTKDVSTDCKYMVFKAQPSSSFKFYTSGDASTFEMPYSEGGAYNSGSSWALGFQHGDGTIFAALYPTAANGPCFSWTDPEFTLASDADGYPVLVVSRGTFDFRTVGGYDASANTFKMTARASEILFGTNVTVLLPEVEMDHANANLLFRGSKLTNCGTVKLKQKYLEFSDGATAQLNSLEIYSASNPQMVVSNATVTVKSNAYIGSSTNGKLIIYDGGNVTINGGDAIQVANTGGNGGVEVHGGSLTTERIRISRGAAGSAKSAYLLMTGGTVTLTGSGIQFQQGCKGNNLGTHYVQLDGGVLKAKSIFRANEDNSGGTVYLSGDGGTYQAYAAGSIAYNISYAECGEKGLTVDTADYNCTFAVDGKNKSGADGLFAKTGAGTLTLTPPSSWTVSRTVAAGGTLKFATDIDMDTALVVTNGAAVSLAGAATKATVDALVVTNGVIALDPGDSIEVKGSLDVSHLKIQWTTLPESPQTFLVVKQAVSTVQLRELKRVCYANALASGKHVSISVAYDDATQTTTVTTEIKDDVPLTDEAKWTGSGAWASSANWENAVKPDATKVAVFGAGASGQSVTVADGDVAGALSFAGGAYRLSGQDALRIDGEQGGARIDVTAGSHVIAAPIDALVSLPVDVSADAELALDGNIMANGVTKTGNGRLVLGGVMDTVTGFESYGGFVTVTNEAALGSDSDKVARIVAGTLEFRHPAGEPMTFDANIALVGPSNRAAVVYKADTDVTLNRAGGNTGLIYKRGVGRLTVDVPADTTVAFSSSSPQADTDAIPVVFPTDGSAPSGTWAPLCIAEGELRFVGHGNSTVTFSGGMKVGVPVSSSSAQASLTIDGINFKAINATPYFGYCATSSGNNMHPVIRVVNGGILHCSGAQPAYSCTESGTTVTFALTNGTYRLDSESYAWLTRGRVNALTDTHAFVRYMMNASRFEVKTAIMNGSLIVDADNGSYFGKNDGTPATLVWSNPERIYGEMFFRNGSTFAVGDITEVAGQNRDLTIAFDDAEWLYDAEHGDKTWPTSTTGHILYEMRGKGVILKPSAGRTFTTLAPFGGVGGLVVDGEGTVAFGANTANFSGTLDVRQGTADFSANGANAALTAVKGAGTVSGATFGSVALPITLLPAGSASNVVTFAGCTFAGTVRVDLGRTAENPLAKPYPQGVVVARYTGAAPDVSGWRLVGTGVKGLRGKFTAANGEVRMGVESSGVMLIMY